MSTTSTTVHEDVHHACVTLIEAARSIETCLTNGYFLAAAEHLSVAGGEVEVLRDLAHAIENPGCLLTPGHRGRCLT